MGREGRNTRCHSRVGIMKFKAPSQPCRCLDAARAVENAWNAWVKSLEMAGEAKHVVLINSWPSSHLGIRHKHGKQPLVAAQIDARPNHKIDRNTVKLLPKPRA